tara:strand:+ start:311 stop:1084 length:774 start_codon:yes stop_codon:yes gene_type:complete
MKNKFNRKKLLIINKNLIILILFFLLFLSIFFYSYSNSNKIIKLFKTNVQNFSDNFSYNLKFSEINGLYNIEKDEIYKIIQPYLNTSIFLLPMDSISNSIYENNWVKSVVLKINYKNKIFVEIKEFKPLGIYIFNNKKYYFNLNGKIIDYANSTNYENKNFIIFKGASSTMHASKLLKVLEKLNTSFIEQIIEAQFIENRRWNLLLNENILLKLSENNLKLSLENYIKLSKDLRKNELTGIKVIDLRDFQKAIIEYK